MNTTPTTFFLQAVTLSSGNYRYYGDFRVSKTPVFPKTTSLDIVTTGLLYELKLDGSDPIMECDIGEDYTIWCADKEEFDDMRQGAEDIHNCCIYKVKYQNKIYFYSKDRDTEVNLLIAKGASVSIIRYEETKPGDEASRFFSNTEY